MPLPPVAIHRPLAVTIHTQLLEISSTRLHERQSVTTTAFAVGHSQTVRTFTCSQHVLVEFRIHNDILRPVQAANDSIRSKARGETIYNNKDVPPTFLSPAPSSVVFPLFPSQAPRAGGWFARFSAQPGGPDDPSA